MSSETCPSIRQQPRRSGHVSTGLRNRREPRGDHSDQSAEHRGDALVHGVPVPSMHLAYTLFSTSTECPARAATSAAGIPALSHIATAACRRSYGRAAGGKATCTGVNASARAACHTRVYVAEPTTPPLGERNSRPSDARPKRSTWA